MSLSILAFAVALAALLVTATVVRARYASKVAMAYCLALLGSAALAHDRFHGVQLGVAAVDLLLLGFLGWIALSKDATWPAAAAALQTITVLGHVSRMTLPFVSATAYAIMSLWTAWPSLLVLAAGIWLDRRAGRTF